MSQTSNISRVSSPGSSRHITTCIPYYGCGRYVRRAVESILAQTHRDISVVVVNDGDRDAPWQWLTEIRDPRLVRFDMLGNYGPYLATAVVLNATSAPYFLIQDADDWSPPDRAACLLERLESEGSDMAVSAQVNYIESTAGSKVATLRWSSTSENGSWNDRFVLRTNLTPRFLYRAPHHGLYRTASIHRVGGYYGGFRVSYDALLTNLMLMTGRLSHVSRPLYFRMVRADSLTQSPDTGIGSRFRQQSERAIAELYGCCFGVYTDYVAGKLNSQNLAASIRNFVQKNIRPESAHQITVETARLRSLLRFPMGRT